MFRAIVLAGGELEGDFRAAGHAVANKAYLDVGGIPMLARVLRALRAAAVVSQIRCVTSPAAFRAAFGGDQDLCDEVIAPGQSLLQSLLTGFSGIPAEERVLVAAADLPLLRAKALDAFGGRDYDYLQVVPARRPSTLFTNPWSRLCRSARLRHASLWQTSNPKPLVQLIAGANRARKRRSTDLQSA